MQFSPTMTVAQAARELNVCQSHIRLLIREGKLTSKLNPERRHEIDPITVAVYKRQREERAARSAISRAAA